MTPISTTLLTLAAKQLMEQIDNTKNQKKLMAKTLGTGRLGKHGFILTFPIKYG
jgi:hypothetical protein